MKPVFRNPDKFQVLPFREWLRKNKPSGGQGYVVEDLDLVLRVYGSRYNQDAIGAFMLIELKFGSAYIRTAQKRTFGLIHKLLRLADPEAKRYAGYFVIQYDNEDWDIAGFRINRKKVTRQEFDNFLDFKIGDIRDNPF